MAIVPFPVDGAGGATLMRGIIVSIRKLDWTNFRGGRVATRSGSHCLGVLRTRAFFKFWHGETCGILCCKNAPSSFMVLFLLKQGLIFRCDIQKIRRSLRFYFIRQGSSTLIEFIENVRCSKTYFRFRKCNFNY